MIADMCAQVFRTPDPGLPGRDVLLDDEAMRRRLGDLLGLDGPVIVEEISCVRVKYRPAESLRAVHRIKVRGTWHLVASRMRTADAEALYRDALDRVAGGDRLRGVAFDAALQCVFWTFPNDRRLMPPAEPLARHPLIARLFATNRIAVDVVGYAPERAVVHRIADTQSGHVLGFAKRFVPGGSGAARRILDALAAANHEAAAPVAVPRLLGGDATDDLLVTEALPGAHLNRLDNAELELAFDALGAAMARLHALPVPPDMPFDDQCASPVIAEAVAQLTFARPDVAAVAAGLAETLDACRPAGAAPVWIHGDLNSRNWLFRRRRDAARADQSSGVGDVGLIDLDQSSAGPAGVDLGGVLAWMRTRTLLGAWSAPRERALEAAVLRGYARHRQVPSPAERAWYRAAALVVQRAARAVTRVRRSHLAVLPDILAAAARDLEAMRHA